MSTKNVKELLKDLSLSVGPSGNEDEPRKVFIESLVDIGIKDRDIHVDSIGNTIVNFGNPKGPRVMIAAHIDEVGYMISHIDDEGYLYFKNIGGMDKHLTPGRHVIIKSGKRYIPGIIGREAIHNIKSEDRMKVLKTNECFIDIGAKNKKCAEKQVKIGDIAVQNPDFIEMGTNIVSGKAFDDRAGVAALAGVIQQLFGENIPYNVFGVATVQEEVGLKGAMVAARQLNPTIGIVLEVGFATDFPGGLNKDGAVKLGAGPVINYGCSMDRALTDEVRTIADNYKINYQVCADPYSDGIDAYSIQTRSNAKCFNIDIPLRYMHTAHEVLDVRDVDKATQLVVSYLKG